MDEPGVTTTSLVKTRRSQADRSADTRAKVIAAARDVLCAQRYSGATMHAIRDATGMSLGAIQHQFPTKAKIMAAVAAEFSAYRIRMYADAIRRGTTPRESMENLIDANFEMAGRPEMAALLEIHLARRNDPDLDREVGPSSRRFDRRVRLWGHNILRAAGIQDDELGQSLQLLNNAVTRGLTVEYFRNPDRARGRAFRSDLEGTNAQSAVRRPRLDDGTLCARAFKTAACFQALSGIGQVFSGCQARGVDDIRGGSQAQQSGERNLCSR